MEESFRLGRVAGIAVGVNWSVLLTVWLLTWSLADRELPAASPGFADGAYWATGLAAAVAFLLSLLAHELGHAVLARRWGVQVEGITLWLFGGVARLGGEAATAAAELRIAAAGPAVSVALAALFAVGASLARSLGASALLVEAVVWLSTINIVLAVFNLVPAAPLDGGRLLRAYLWQRRGDRYAAAVSATNAGRGFGFVLIVAGFMGFALGGGLGALWLAFLGWFLHSAATAERTDVLLRVALAGVRVRDVMTPHPIVAPQDLRVSTFLDEYVLRHRCSAFPLIGRNGAVTGLATLSDLKKVPADQRAAVAVREVAHAVDDVHTAEPDDAVIDVLARFGANQEHRVLVFSDGQLVGIISPSDIVRLVRAALWMVPGQAPPWRP